MSKELDALECIVVDLAPTAKEHNKEEIEQLKKSLEALEIIKEKGLDILEFRHAFSLYEYNACKSVGCEELTPEEYGLLKKVLK